MAILRGYDSNDLVKHRILLDLLVRLYRAEVLFPEDADEESRKNQLAPRLRLLLERFYTDPSLRKSQFFDIIEFGRTVHAEMSALMSAAKLGHSVKDAVLYCTTFPCHECARHIIGAGIGRVVYVEAYAKSRVRELHSDSAVFGRSGNSKNRVAFEPFIGIAPPAHETLFSWVDRKSRWIEPGKGACDPWAPGKSIDWVPAARLRGTVEGRFKYMDDCAEEVDPRLASTGIAEVLIEQGAPPGEDEYAMHDRVTASVEASETVAEERNGTS
jgi:deoxycytidylate deaminase